MRKYFSLILILLAFSSFAQIPAGYYDNAEGLRGDALKAALHSIIKNHTTYPYTSASTDVWDILKESDRDPNNPENVILLYTGWSVNAAQEYNSGAGWSREHVWAKSHGGFDEVPPAGTDAHHLRPADVSVNSARGNKDFDNGGTRHAEATECFTDADSWEPRPSVKGDVARMMFYMATRYEGDVAGEPDLELVDYTPTDGPIFGKLSTLLLWNEQDPVDDFERNRNEVVFSYQHNRNPFIDHPEFVNAIYIPNNAPVIADQTFTIAENSTSGTEVGTVIGSDQDGDNITFSILSGNTNNAFTISSSTGLLTVNNSAALDYNINPVFSLSVQVSDGDLTSSATITINVDPVNGYNPLASNSVIKIYPNPANAVLNIIAPDNFTIEIYSIIGNKILSTNQKQIDMQRLLKGIYFVVIKNENGFTIKTEKIQKL